MVQQLSEVASAQRDGQRAEARATDLAIRLAFLGLFAYWSLELVRPFLPVVIWAVLLTVALYPAYDRLARRLGGRRGIAAFIVTALVLATVIGPVSILVSSLADSVQWLATGVRTGTLQVSPPPPQVETWPLVGEQLDEAWELASTSLEDALHRYGPAVLPPGGTVLGKVAALGADVLLFVVSAGMAGFLLVPGPRLAAGARQFAARLIAPRGEHFVDLAGATIRNVSRGVIGVALLQTILAGIILEVAGVAGAGLIAFVVLILCIVQIGPAPVLVPVIIWSWTAMSGTGALILTLMLVPVMLMDNLLKPILMARGLTTPMLVILIGVIGGTITHGLIGLFLGPIVLAVFYELVVAWVRLAPARAIQPEE
jgi:predicted PurR-regulated permease PerM